MFCDSSFENLKSLFVWTHCYLVCMHIAVAINVKSVFENIVFKLIKKLIKIEIKQNGGETNSSR